MKLLASYHGIYDDDDFNSSRVQIAELTSQAVLYAQLIDVEFERLAEVGKMQASGARAYNDLARVRYRNWISSVNSDSGAWLSAGLSPKLFQMSNNEFVSAVCRSDDLPDRPLRVRYEQKRAKYGPTADRYSSRFF